MESFLLLRKQTSDRLRSTLQPSHTSTAHWTYIMMLRDLAMPLPTPSLPLPMPTASVCHSYLFTGQGISQAMLCRGHTVVMMVCTLASKLGEVIGCMDTQLISAISAVRFSIRSGLAVKEASSFPALLSEGRCTPCSQCRRGLTQRL